MDSLNTETMSRFKDYFSVQSTDYRDFRPTYPTVLFQFIANIAPGQALAWDCATGNGQAAVSLAAFFRKIIGTDASARQIQSALPHPKIEYRVCPAEHTDLETNSVDLITVAQALHWFDHKKFFLETQRVSKPKGILAIWSYRLHRITPEIDEIILKYYDAILGNYWPQERKMVDNDYAGIDCPFTPVAVPEAFNMRAYWNFSHLLGYLNTWSAARLYSQKNQTNAFALIQDELAGAWGDPD